MNLLKSQANLVFVALREQGWNPADFEWRNVTSLISRKTISKLVHKPSGYYFTFDNDEGVCYSTFSPSVETESQTVNFGRFFSQLSGLHSWLGYLKRETEAPDLWGAISQGAGLIESATSDTDNTPFTTNEKTYILSGLNEIKQYLLTEHKLDPELVEAQIKYLVESSDRVGRKDWKNLLLATLVGLAMSGMLPSESVRAVFMFVATALSQILKTSLLLT